MATDTLMKLSTTEGEVSTVWSKGDDTELKGATIDVMCFHWTKRLVKFWMSFDQSINQSIKKGYIPHVGGCPE